MSIAFNCPRPTLHSLADEAAPASDRATHRRRVAALMGATVLALSLVACGGGGDTAPAPAQVTATPTPTPTPAAPAFGTSLPSTPAPTAPAAPPITPPSASCNDDDSGRITTPYPTINNITVEWAFASSADSSSDVSVRYRPQGTTAWATGMPLRRIGSETSAQGRRWTARHSGSVFDVQAGTAYEVELTRTQASGGGSSTRCVTVTTRNVPAPMANAAVIEATPSNLLARLGAASAGNIIELTSGTYPGFMVDKAGTPGRPLVIRPKAGAVVTIEGRIDIAADHIMLTGLSIHGTVKFNGAKHFSFTRNTLTARTDGGYLAASEGHGIYSFARNENAYIADNVITGTTTAWNDAALGVNGGNLGEGIALTGPGHVIQNNRVSNFRDNISLLEDGEAVDQFSIDILNNDLSYAADDGIEADFCAHNCRIMRNRLTNVFIAISAQPSLGGPSYFVRNVVYNAVHVAFKLYRSSYGDVLLHNTVVKSGDGLGIYAGLTVGRLYSRNNLFIGGPGGTYGGYSNGTGRVLAIADLDAASADMNNDALGSTVGSFSARLGGSTYSSLAQLQASAFERNAVQVDFANTFAAAVGFPSVPMSSYTAPDLRLASGSPAVNSGAVIPNINDGHAGSAPDAGAYEMGTVLPVYGPR